MVCATYWLEAFQLQVHFLRFLKPDSYDKQPYIPFAYLQICLSKFATRYKSSSATVSGHIPTKCFEAYLNHVPTKFRYKIVYSDVISLCTTLCNNPYWVHLVNGGSL
jgi:hypothetical protein